MATRAASPYRAASPLTSSSTALEASMAATSPPSLTSQIARIRTTTPATGRPCGYKDTPADSGHVVPGPTAAAMSCPRLTISTTASTQAGANPGPADRDLGLVPTGDTATQYGAIARTLVQPPEWVDTPHPVDATSPILPPRPSGRFRFQQGSAIKWDMGQTSRPPACRRGRAPGREPGRSQPCRRSPVSASGRRSRPFAGLRVPGARSPPSGPPARARTRRPTHPT